MKSILNKFLVSLYSHFRKRNDPDIATFHSKAIIAVAILVYCFIFYMIFGNMLLFDGDFKTLPPLRREIVLITTVLLWISVSYFTNKSSDLEKIEITKSEIRKGFISFFIFLGVGLLFFFILSIHFGGVK